MKGDEEMRDDRLSKGNSEVLYGNIHGTLPVVCDQHQKENLEKKRGQRSRKRECVDKPIPLVSSIPSCLYKKKSRSILSPTIWKRRKNVGEVMGDFKERNGEMMKRTNPLTDFGAPRKRGPTAIQV